MAAMVSGRTVLRAAFAVIVVLSAAVIVSGYVTFVTAADQPTPPDGSNYSEGANVDRSPARANTGVTVVTTDSNRQNEDLGEIGGPEDDPRAEAEIVAYDHNGSVIYYNDTHDRYWDVDPSPKGEMTVEYVASDQLNGSACELDASDRNGPDPAPTDQDTNTDDADTDTGGDTDPARTDEAVEENACTRAVIERLNLSTGVVTPIYEEVAPSDALDPWRDADRINNTHYAVADMARNQVFGVDTRTGEYTWEWYASTTFAFDTGGNYLQDWTHMNGVEVLPDGRIMASVRNHDRVVFLDPERPPERAVVAGWTLGEDNHTVLREQYGPDYVPPANGGPAVVVADAGNDRVVEYQRRNGTWVRTWEWTDGPLQWPRDADRLLNGHTLVTDTNGDRVVEVDRTGAVVWNVSVGLPYDAERIETGPKRTDGPSATRIVAGRSGDGADGAALTAEPNGTNTSVAARITGTIEQWVPKPVVTGMLYVSPLWVDVLDLLALCVLVVTALCWLVAELRWQSALSTLEAWADERP